MELVKDFYGCYKQDKDPEKIQDAFVNLSEKLGWRDIMFVLRYDRQIDIMSTQEAQQI